MLNENIKTLRKNKGFTQEELAVRLHVTRQTISKWEKGYSVPDASMLTDMAEVLEVSVADLLGAENIDPEKTDAVVEQLVRINEQLTVRNRRSKRIWTGILIAAVLVFIVIPLLITVPGMLWYSGKRAADTGNAGSTEWTYELDGKEYECSVQYDEDFAIISLSEDGDSELNEELNLEACRDAKEVKNRLESYFEEHGGELVHAATKGVELVK